MQIIAIAFIILIANAIIFTLLFNNRKS